MTAYAASAHTARDMDAWTIEKLHTPSLLLMEHAAMACAARIEKKAKKKDRIVIVCGPGNNGADGMAIARLLFLKGYSIQVICQDHPFKGEEAIQAAMLESLEIETIQKDDLGLEAISRAHIIVDAIFGSGLSRDVSGLYAGWIAVINASGAYVFSVDIASGLEGNTGAVLGCAVKAHETLSLDCLKFGSLLQDGAKLSGKLRCLDIGIPDGVHTRFHAWKLLTRKEAARLLPERRKDGHKGTFGKILLAGGCTHMHGAIAMAASACYHAGAGTLTLLVPDAIHEILALKMNQAMIFHPDLTGYLSTDSAALLEEKRNEFSLIGIGSGMSREESSYTVVKAALESDVTVVVDADGLNALAGHTHLLERDACTILTPHVKEMSRLCGWSTQKILQDPFACAQDFCARYPNVVLVLKSQITLVCQRHTGYLLCHPNPRLAKGGSGDILFGILCALAAGTSNPLQAAAAGVALHSLAARNKQDSACFQPETIIENLNSVFCSLRKH